MLKSDVATQCSLSQKKKSKRKVKGCQGYVKKFENDNVGLEVALFQIFNSLSIGKV